MIVWLAGHTISSFLPKPSVRRRCQPKKKTKGEIARASPSRVMSAFIPTRSCVQQWLYQSCLQLYVRRGSCFQSHVQPMVMCRMCSSSCTYRVICAVYRKTGSLRKQGISHLTAHLSMASLVRKACSLLTCDTCECIRALIAPARSLRTTAEITHINDGVCDLDEKDLRIHEIMFYCLVVT